MKKSLKILCLMLSLMLLLCACADKDAGTSSPESSEPANASAVSDEPSAIPSEEPSDEPSEEPSEPDLDPLDGFVPVFRAIACSDTHVSSTGDVTATRLANLFKSAYKYASAHEAYNTVDAMLVAGDLTNAGKPSELKAWKSIADANIKEETTLMTVMGNHEYYDGGIASYTENMDPNLDKHIVVNGYHFIGISTRGEDSYPTEVQNWLREELEKAAADDPEKPIFVFMHHHLENTVYVSRTWNTGFSSQIRNILKKYPQVIHFSGHSHGPINNPLTIWQDNFTTVGTGTLAYFEMESGMTEGTVPKSADQAAQFHIIEVDANNRVRIMPYNLLTDSFFKTPANTDNPEKQLVYSIDKPSDKSTFIYTKERYKNPAKPYFAEGAKLTVSDVTTNGAQITVPTAFDSSCLYSYHVVCTPAEGSDATKREFRYYAQYYFEPMPESQVLPATGLKDNTEYTIDVYPVSIWNTEGEPLTVKVTTDKKEDIIYSSTNPVTYLGTFCDFESITELTRSDDCLAYGGTIGGDVFGGDWCGNGSDTMVGLELVKGKGWKGSTALGVSYNAGSHVNRGLYVFATDANKNPVKYPDFRYLRVWVDFTDVEFRKACFGLVDGEGKLFSTDDCDNQPDSPFYYLAEGETEWKTYQHGSDGCFGAAEGSRVNNFKGWMAFPVDMFGARNAGGLRFSGNYVKGVYLYWDFEKDSMLNTPFYLDELQLVDDYTVFEEYKK